MVVESLLCPFDNSAEANYLRAFSPTNQDGRRNVITLVSVDTEHIDHECSTFSDDNLMQLLQAQPVQYNAILNLSFVSR